MKSAIRFVRIRTRLALVASAFVLATGCAVIPPDSGTSPIDPLETYNRHVFEFNERADRYVLKPVAEGYTNVVPEPVRNCVGNIFGNLADVGNALNNLLQGKPADAASDLCRVAINSTIGLLGCFDVARKAGLTKSNEDFGQTFGRWGVGPGPYFVLPLFGPSTIRDTFGRAADVYADPIHYVEDDAAQLGGQSLRVVDTRAQLLRAGQLLDGAALDKYRFIRDAYLQRRRNLVFDGNPPRDRDSDEEDAVDKSAAKPDGVESKTKSVEPKEEPVPDQPKPSPTR